MAVAQRPREVRVTTREEAILRLTQRIARFERVYEVSTEELLGMLERGERQETAEIARWLVEYHTLERLRQ